MDENMSQDNCKATIESLKAEIGSLKDTDMVIGSDENVAFRKNVDLMKKSQKLFAFDDFAFEKRTGDVSWSMNVISDADLNYFIENGCVKLMENSKDMDILVDMFYMLIKCNPDPRLFSQKLCHTIYTTCMENMLKSKNLLFNTYFGLFVNLLKNPNRKCPIVVADFQKIYSKLVNNLFEQTNECADYSSHLRVLGVLDSLVSKICCKNLVYNLAKEDQLFYKILVFLEQFTEKPTHDHYSPWRAYLDGIECLCRDSKKITKEFSEVFTENGNNLSKLLLNIYDRMHQGNISTLWHMHYILCDLADFGCIDDNGKILAQKILSKVHHLIHGPFFWISFENQENLAIIFENLSKSFPDLKRATENE